MKNPNVKVIDVNGNEVTVNAYVLIDALNAHPEVLNATIIDSDDIAYEADVYRCMVGLADYKSGYDMMSKELFNHVKEYCYGVFQDNERIMDAIYDGVSSYFGIKRSDK